MNIINVCNLVSLDICIHLCYCDYDPGHKRIYHLQKFTHALLLFLLPTSDSSSPNNLWFILPRLRSPTLQVDSFTIWATREALQTVYTVTCCCIFEFLVVLGLLLQIKLLGTFVYKSLLQTYVFTFLGSYRGM